MNVIKSSVSFLLTIIVIIYEIKQTPTFNNTKHISKFSFAIPIPEPRSDTNKFSAHPFRNQIASTQIIGIYIFFL